MLSDANICTTAGPAATVMFSDAGPVAGTHTHRDLFLIKTGMAALLLCMINKRPLEPGGQNALGLRNTFPNCLLKSLHQLN